MKIEWMNGFVIKTEINKNGIVIKANKEGLLSLAGHFQKLSITRSHPASRYVGTIAGL